MKSFSSRVISALEPFHHLYHYACNISHREWHGRRANHCNFRKNYCCYATDCSFKGNAVI